MVSRRLANISENADFLITPKWSEIPEDSVFLFCRNLILLREMIDILGLPILRRDAFRRCSFVLNQEIRILLQTSLGPSIFSRSYVPLTQHLTYTKPVLASAVTYYT
jgi:hypothetical protein